MATRYQDLKAAGLCVACGQTAAADDRVHCRPCGDMIAERLRKKRKDAADVGMCSGCAYRQAAPEQRTCRVCSDRAIANYRSLEGDARALRMQQSTDSRNRAVAEGKCRDCRQPRQQGHTYCSVCLEKKHKPKSKETTVSA